MKRSTALLITSSLLLLPSAGCSLIAKTGATLNGKPLDGKPVAATSSPSSQKANEPSKAASVTKPSPFKAPPPPAAQVADSVPAIPASLKVAAATGAPVISLQGASWCGDDVKGLDWGDGKIDREFPRALKKVDDLYQSGLESMSSMGRFACGGSQSADRMTWVQSYMQARANETGMSQEHQVHLMSVLASLQSFDLRDFVNQAPESCKAFEAKGNPDALESNRNQARRIGMGCADGTSADWMAWWMDRGETIPSQIEALGWLYSSFAYSARVVSFQTGMTALHDAQQFDQGAFFAELKELGADDRIIAKAILQFSKVSMKLAAWKRHYSEELGEDYAVLTKAASDGFDNWVQAYKQEKAAVDFAFGMEEAVLSGDSRKFQGCSEKARSFATEFVMRNKPTTAEDIQNAAAHPIGSLIVAAAYECEKAQGHALLASVYAQMLKSAPIARGPRFASRLALVKAIAEIKAVRSRFPLRARDFMPPSKSGGFGKTRTGYFTTGQGVVASAKKQGEALEVSFKKETWKEPVYKCTETNRLDRIEADGTLVYRKNCKQTGTKTIVSQEKPVSIPADAATGIKPGAFLVIARSKDNSSQGLPRHVYKSVKRDKLLNYYGLPLVR